MFYIEALTCWCLLTVNLEIVRWFNDRCWTYRLRLLLEIASLKYFRLVLVVLLKPGMAYWRYRKHFVMRVSCLQNRFWSRVLFSCYAFGDRFLEGGSDSIPVLRRRQPSHLHLLLKNRIFSTKLSVFSHLLLKNWIFSTNVDETNRTPNRHKTGYQLDHVHR